MKFINKFWDWYEDNLKLNLGIASLLFIWQFIHLIWLFSDVILKKIWGVSFFELSGTYEYLIIVIDYTEIPAILSVSLLYLNDLRKSFNWKSVWFLIFLNVQWLHLFWITDEFVLNKFSGDSAAILPVWLAWTAIAIDYLELPVMYDTVKKFILSFKKK